ncbi:MAG: hypothetical protein IPM64_10740 [Phycisphaerales bacterium]|nr:hypothetical protein [Phycisphaerales bacterium]
MTSIFEITDWSHVASFFIWTLAVCALAKAIFGSFLAAELQHRLALRDAPKRQRMTRLNWELTNRVRYDPDAARGSQHAARIPLTDAELEARRREMQRLTGNSLGRRALLYFTNCFACQTFWVAVATFAVTRGIADVAGLLFTAAAYAAAAVLLSGAVMNRPSPPRSDAPSARTPCKSCGR